MAVFSVGPGTGVSGFRWTFDWTVIYPPGEYRTYRTSFGQTVQIAYLKFSSGYDHPVYCETEETGGRFQMTDSSGRWIDHEISRWSTDRTCTLVATKVEERYDYYLRLKDSDGASLVVWRDLDTTATSKRWYLEDYQPTKAGYTFKGWSLTRGGSVYLEPTGTWLQVYGGDDTLYAVWEKITIPLLYWDGSSGTRDADIIKKGEVFSNLKAERWNAMNAKIKLLNSAYTYSTVTAGVSRMTAQRFNDARAGIQNLTGHGTLPAAAVVNATVKASYFQASTACLKTALNSAITYYNNL